MEDEVDRLGPFSVGVMRRHGVLFPPNVFLQVPLLEAARGGRLLTGFGGDEILATWRWSYHADLLAGRRRPTLRDPIRLARAAAPAAWRRRWERRRWHWGENLPWLRPEAAHAVSELAFAARADQPRSWPRWLDWVSRRRTLSAARWSFSLLAADAGANVVHPLLDPLFLHALARAGGRLGLGERTNRPAADLRWPPSSTGARTNHEGQLRQRVLGEPKPRVRGPVGRQRRRSRTGGSGGAQARVAQANPERGTAMLLHAAWRARSRREA